MPLVLSFSKNILILCNILPERRSSLANFVTSEESSVRMIMSVPRIFCFYQDHRVNTIIGSECQKYQKARTVFEQFSQSGMPLKNWYAFYLNQRCLPACYLRTVPRVTFALWKKSAAWEMSWERRCQQIRHKELSYPAVIMVVQVIYTVILSGLLGQVADMTEVIGTIVMSGVFLLTYTRQCYLLIDRMSCRAKTLEAIRVVWCLSVGVHEPLAALGSMGHFCDTQLSRGTSVSAYLNQYQIKADTSKQRRALLKELLNEWLGRYARVVRAVKLCTYAWLVLTMVHSFYSAQMHMWRLLDV